MFFQNEWTKQIFSGFLAGTILICSSLGVAQDLGIVFTLGGTKGPEIQPSWWAARGVLDPEKDPANPSLVNVGQLKWITRQLHEELSTLLPAEANFFALNTVMPDAPKAFERLMPFDQNYANWQSGNQSAASLGQVKNCAVKFYDFLHSVSPAWLSDQLTRTGHPNDGRKYPWTVTDTDDQNKAAANIGQLKAVFALRLRESLDDDLLPDIFEHSLIKFVPAFAGKTLNDITWQPGDAAVSLKGTDANGQPNTTLTSTLVPNLNGSKNGVISASSLLAEHQPVGSVGGSFSVGGDGSANYSVPINIPKGTSGVEPQLALSYSSGAGNGALGVGFDISGFQRITRGATDRLKDGYTDPVDFDENDRFFLDGQLLIATHNASGAAATAADYGKAGTVYQTENNSFARIISHGQTGSGPSYWTVQTKAGLTIELGNCSTSCVSKGVLAGKGALVWNVNKVSDNVGNFYRVTYQLDNASSGPLDYRLAQVHYTGNANTAPYNEIHFQWEDRPDVATSYIQGVKVFNQKRLARIEIKSQGSTLYYYELGYTKNLANNASQLTTLTRCIDANNKMPPTRFNWAKEAALQTIPKKWWSSTKAEDNYPEWNSGESKLNGLYDLNGDGLLDRVAHYNYDGPDKSYGLWVSLNTGSGFAAATKWWSSTRTEDNYPEWISSGSKLNGFIDLNGDSLLDRVCHRKYGANGANGELGLWVSLNTGSGFAEATKWWGSTRPDDNFLEWNYGGSQINGFMDFNGDGLLDRMAHYNYDGPDKSYGLWVSLNTGSGFSAATKWWSSARAEDNYPEWISSGSKLNGFIDLNGDSLLDRVCHRKYGANGANGELGLWVSLNTGSSFAEATKWWGSDESR